MMLALRPDLVRMDLAAPGNTDPLTELVPALRSGGVRAVSESGVLGDPTGATAAEGLQLLDELAATIAVEIADWRNRP
jgi:creatinine amidohydrolase